MDGLFLLSLLTLKWSSSGSQTWLAGKSIISIDYLSIETPFKNFVLGFPIASHIWLPKGRMNRNPTKKPADHWNLVCNPSPSPEILRLVRTNTGLWPKRVGLPNGGHHRVSGWANLPTNKMEPLVVDCYPQKRLFFRDLVNFVFFELEDAKTLLR